MGQNRQNYHAPKFEFSTTPRSSIFLKNWKLRLWRQIKVGTLWVHLRANGSHWVQKMGKNRQKIPCRKISVFDYPAVIHFWQKIEVTVMAPNLGGDPLKSILGPMGSHWVQKMDLNVPNYYVPKFEFSTTHRFFLKNGRYGYGAKSRWGPHRFHLGANGVPLGKKNGSKP